MNGGAVPAVNGGCHSSNYEVLKQQLGIVGAVKESIVLNKLYIYICIFFILKLGKIHIKFNCVKLLESTFF